MFEKTLPDKPSALLRVALADLRLVEADPRYKVNMAEWHTANPGDGICHVCLAGAALAKTVGHPREDARWGEFGGRLESQLEALNDFRRGDVEMAFDQLNLRAAPGDQIPPDREIADYNDHPEGFHAQLLQLADELEAAGY